MIKRLMMLVVASLTAGLSFAALPDPIAWWTMDEFVAPGLAKDVTGNGYDFQSVGSDVRFEEGPFGLQAIRFGDTRQAWAQVKAPNLQQATARKYTVSMWLRLEKNGGQLGGSVNTYPYLYSSFNGDRVHVTYESADGLTCYVSSTAFSGKHGTREQWNFVTLVVDAEKVGDSWTTRVVSYVNGASQADNTKTFAAMGGFTSTFILGNNGVDATRPINAAIADLRIYDSALTAAQVKELHVDSARPRTPRLVAYWPMDEIVTSGSVRTTPVVGNGFSDMTLGTDVTSVPGVHGQAVRYGLFKESYGETKCLLPSGLGSWSFAAWLKNPYLTTNANVRLYEWYDANRMQLNTAAGNLQIYCNVGYGGDAYGFRGAATGVVQREGWSHFAVSYDYGYAADCNSNTCAVTYFVNGKKVTNMPGGLLAAGHYLNKFLAPSNSLFQLGGMHAASKPNSCNGAFDDVCIFAGVLDESAAKELYDGAKKVNAGIDFSVARETTVLRGEVDYGLMGLIAVPKAKNVRWELVSAPAGGDAARIVTPESPTTEVILPVAGAYVFRLTSPNRFLPQTDTVTVTRRAPKQSNTPPTLTVTCPASIPVDQPLAMAVAAADEAGDTVVTSVSKLSGPGGVWFDGRTSSMPKARFSAVGSYTLRVSADDGEAKVTNDVTVSVVASTIAAGLDDKLIHAWSLDDGAFEDDISGTEMAIAPTKNLDVIHGCFAPGLVGYGFHAEGFKVTDATKTDTSGGYSDYIDTKCTLDETPTTAGTPNTRPTDQWKSFSLWMKLDSALATAYDFDAATLIGVPATFRLDFGDRSNPNGAQAFSIYQQGAAVGNPTDSSVQYSVQYFTAPTVSVADRWAHVCVLVDRWGVKNSQIWVDGKQLTRTGNSGQSDRAGRAVANNICVGGWPYNGHNTHDYGNRSADGTLRTRAFPGVIDEVKVWNRKITEAEIAYLAANPCPVAQKRAPSVDAVAKTLKPSPKKAFTIDLGVYTDGLPTGTDVTYAWTVLDGEAANVTFSDPNVRKPTITIKKAGQYRLQLAATDGALTSYSKPIDLDVPPAGLIVVIQ